MQDTAIVFVFLGIVVAIVGWFSGRSRQAQRACAFSAAVTERPRRPQLAARGMNTGGFGAWLYRQRVLVRLIILALAIVLLFALRPLSIGDIVLTLVLASRWCGSSSSCCVARDPLSPVTAADTRQRCRARETRLPMESGDTAEPTDDDLVTRAVSAAATADAATGMPRPITRSRHPKPRRAPRLRRDLAALAHEPGRLDDVRERGDGLGVGARLQPAVGIDPHAPLGDLRDRAAR